MTKKRRQLGRLKRLVVAGIAILSVLIALIFWNHHRSTNIDTHKPFVEQVEATLANSRQWMLDHREVMKQQVNPTLTHMVHDMQAIAPDPLLETLENDYLQTR